MVTIKNKLLRNTQEQVQKNKEDIAAHYEADRVIGEFGIKVIGQVNTAADIPEGTYAYGDAYAVGTTAPYDFYIYTRASEGHPTDYWFNIGKLAIVGPQGPSGDNIQSIRKTSTSGLVDTYTITLTDGSTTSFTVTNGEKGDKGDTGATGATGSQGPVGPTGLAVRIVAIVANKQALPSPSTLQDLTKAYLVGTAEPYELYCQVGDDVATAVWKKVNTSFVAYWEVANDKLVPIEGVNKVHMQNAIVNNLETDTIYAYTIRSVDEDYKDTIYFNLNGDQTEMRGRPCFFRQDGTQLAGFDDDDNYLYFYVGDGNQGPAIYASATDELEINNSLYVDGKLYVGDGIETDNFTSMNYGAKIDGIHEFDFGGTKLNYGLYVENQLFVNDSARFAGDIDLRDTTGAEIYMDEGIISGLDAPTNDNDAARKKYVDDNSKLYYTTINVSDYYVMLYTRDDYSMTIMNNETLTPTKWNKINTLATKYANIYSGYSASEGDVSQGTINKYTNGNIRIAVEAIFSGSVDYYEFNIVAATKKVSNSQDETLTIRSVQVL